MSYGQLAEKLLGIKTARETVTHSAVSDIVSNADGSITRNIVNTEITALIGNRTNSDETSTLHVIVSTKTLENIGLADYIIHANRRWTVDKIIKDATGSGWSLYCSFETEGSLVPVIPIDPDPMLCVNGERLISMDSTLFTWDNGVITFDADIENRVGTMDATTYRWDTAERTFDEDIEDRLGRMDSTLLTWDTAERTFDEDAEEASITMDQTICRFDSTAKTFDTDVENKVCRMDTTLFTFDTIEKTFDNDIDCTLGTFDTTLYTWDTTEVDFDTEFV